MVAAGTVEALVEADVAFHAAIADSAGNSVLSSLLDSLSTRTLRARVWRGMAGDRALEITRAEHDRMYQAILRRDPELAGAAATVHVSSGELWLRQQLEPAGEVSDGQAASTPDPSAETGEP